jgi:hypothetical protein
MRHLRRAAAIGFVLTATLAAACVETRHEGPTSPTQLVQTLATGNWTSTGTAAATALDPGTCGNLQWQITSMTSTSASGTFKATCGGGLTLEGSAEGKLNGATADLKASGTVTGAGMTCAFSLTGTAVPESLDTIRINYSGTTCLGPVSGSEVLKRR